MVAIKPILFIDDSPRDTFLAIEALTQCKLENEVVALSDGIQALDYLFRRGKYRGLDSRNPAVILLDLKMPMLDGLEVLRQIKSDSSLKLIPVVMMTSSREDEDVVKSYQLGVNAYIVKPDKFDDLVKAIHQLSSFWTLINVPPPNTVQSRF